MAKRDFSQVQFEMTTERDFATALAQQAPLFTAAAAFGIIRTVIKGIDGFANTETQMHHRHPPLLTFGLAILSSAAALLLTLATPLRTGSPFLLSVVAVMVSAAYGGLLPGLLAGLLATATSVMYVLPPQNVFSLTSLDDVLRLVVFVAIALFVSSLTASRERAHESARARAQQYVAAAELGRRALATADLATVFSDAAELVAHLLRVDYSQVLELLPGGDQLVLRAGVGFEPGAVGRDTVPASPDFEPGYTLKSSDPVVVRDQRREKRFRVSPLLADRAVVSGASVIIPGPEQPFGVMAVHATRRREFSKEDLDLLSSLAGLLAQAVQRERAEAEVRQQREWLGVTLSSIGDGVISTDTDGRITFMNTVAERLTGWKSDEAAGMALDSVFHAIDEETRQIVASPVQRVMRDQRVVGQANHTLLVSKDGRHVPIDDSGAPIRDPSGNLMGVVLVFRDIAGRRATERDLARLAALVNSSEDAIISQTLEGIVLSWNPAAERLYGYTADEMIGRPIQTTYPPDRLGEYSSIIARLKRGESVEHHDTVRVTKSGRRIDVSISVSLVRDSSGAIVGVSKIARDITGRKRTEDAIRFLAEASDVLSSSLDYETTLQSVARLAVPRIADWCAVHIRTEDGSVRQLALAHVDPTKAAAAEELMRRYPQDLNARGGIRGVLRTGRPEIVPEIGDNTLAATARDIKHLKLLVDLGVKSYMAVPLLARGRILGVLTFVSGETERRYGPADLQLAQDLARRAALAVDNARLYRESQTLAEDLEQRVVQRTIELQNANIKLEKGMAERQRINDQLRLLSAHLQSAREEERIRIAREMHDEIGQVLTALKMDLSLLERETAEAGAAPPLESIHEEIASTIRLVDETITTMHAIIRELRPEVLDHLGLRSALEWQIQEFQSRTHIECEFSAELDDAEYDPDRSTALFRILQETLTNVARHAQATRVQVSITRQDGQLVLRVQDNGKGIDPEMLAGSNRFGILGMRERARAFGGDVDIAGGPGQGTVVTARIPIQ